MSNCNFFYYYFIRKEKKKYECLNISFLLEVTKRTVKIQKSKIYTQEKKRKKRKEMKT